MPSDPPLRLITALWDLVVRVGRLASGMKCAYVTSASPQPMIAILGPANRLSLFRGHANTCHYRTRRIRFSVRGRNVEVVWDEGILERNAWRFILEVEMRVAAYTHDLFYPGPRRRPRHSLPRFLFKRSADVVFADPAYRMPIPDEEAWQEYAQQFDEPDRLALQEEDGRRFLVLRESLES
jgi:hypothetical protein